MSLTASYSSPSSTVTFAQSLPALPAQSVPDKTAYLSALRAGISQIQADINADLTRRMEEDKAATEKTGGAKGGAKEEKAEEMYGEEGGEEEG